MPNLRSRLWLASVVAAFSLTVPPAMPFVDHLVVLAQEEPAPGEVQAPPDQNEGEPPPASEPQSEAPPPASAEPGAVLAPEPAEGAQAPAAPQEPPEVASPPAPPAPPEPPITVDGQNTFVSRPFALRGGEYSVAWTAQTSNPECAFTATLHDSATTRPIQPLGGGQIFGGRGSGTAALHAVPPASYYVDAISTCRWTLTITPVS